MAEAATAALDLVRRRPPTLGTGRLVCVDGPAGSGKTTVAAALARLAPDAEVVHTDEMLAGWGGLPGLAATVSRLLRPLSRGEAGTWRRWDWVGDGWAEEHRVAPGGLLVLEGVGSAPSECADLVGCLVWVEAPSAERLARGLARDGEQMRPQWEQWRLDEDLLHGQERTRDRADVLVDGLTGAVRSLRV